METFKIWWTRHMERAQYVAAMATILYERLFIDIVLAVIHQIPLLMIQ